MNNNNDFKIFFITLGLINLSIGLDNNQKNIIQAQKQTEIDTKLNKILELLGNGR